MVRNMNLGKTSRPTSTLVCEVCTEDKQYAAMLGNDAERQTTKPLKIVRLDICGPMKNISVGGTKKFVTLVDDFFKNVCVYMMKSKG